MQFYVLLSSNDGVFELCVEVAYIFLTLTKIEVLLNFKISVLIY